MASTRRRRARSSTRRSSGRRSIDSFRKLTPRRQVRNPVMFVVYVGSILTTLLWVQALVGQGRGAGLVHLLGLGLALVHRALRQLRRGDGGRARQGAGGLAPQGAARPPGQAPARSRARRARFEIVSASALRKGDVVLVEAGDFIPADGDVVEGVASVNESGHHRRERAGHPRERRRPQLGHRRHPGALRLDRRASHRQPGRGLPRPHDRAGRGRQAAEDAERDRARHPARGADHRLPARHGDAAAVLALQRRRRPGRARRSPSPCSWRCSSA